MLLAENRSLLDGFRKGDRAAMEEIYVAYGPAITGFLRGGFSFQSGGRQCRFHGTRSEFDLEDRLHDVFARAFSESARKSYDGLSSYSAYLKTIARNLVIDDFRRKERALVEYSIEQTEAAADPALDNVTDALAGHAGVTGDPQKDAESRELVALVAQFKDTLGAREARVYALRFEQGMEHKEVSAKTGLSPSKIKTSEQRIRARFFEFMKRHGYFAGYQQKQRGWLAALRSH